MVVPWWLSLAASAHVALEDPVPRYASDGFTANKACPCGLGPNDTYCSQATRSDPNRVADHVTTYEAGEVITIRLDEAVGHEGRWRIAFDDDGADMDDFNATILLDVADPAGEEGNIGEGSIWEFEVTLPDVACDNCTLQVIQVMNGDTVNPVADPTGSSTYYQCADIELTAAATTPGTTTTTPPGTTTTPTTPTDTTPGTTEPTDTGGDAEATDDALDKGCGCVGVGAAPPWAWLLPLAAVGLRRRRYE